jgi:hypothetical protein
VARTSATLSSAVTDRVRGLVARGRRGGAGNRGAAASAGGPTGRGDQTPDHTDSEVDRLVAEGRLVDAVDLLATEYRENRDPAAAIRLVDLRHRAAAAVEAGPGRSPWPPSYDDPFPGVAGRLPEVQRSELTADVLGGAVAHHGALVVRGLFDEHQVASGREVIQTARRRRDELPAGSQGNEWFRPFPQSEQRDRVLRKMVADKGGTWLADSPAATAHFLDELTAAGAVGAIAEHMGERPCFSLQKSTMRRSLPVAELTGWHQDGSFLGADVRTMNVWVTLSRCGGDHPAPGLEIVPRRFDEILPVEGWSRAGISFELIDQIAAETPVLRPAFEAGDALMFDERFVHRTFLDASMTEVRFALECWFFALSHPADSYLSLLV